jgi:hypothetical protein
MDLNLLPGRSLGPIVFGMPIAELSAHIDTYYKGPLCEGDNSKEYGILMCNVDIVTDESECVEFVTCRDHMYYNYIDLFALDKQAVLRLLGSDVVHTNSYGIDDAVEYPSLGLTIWFRNDMIRAIACGRVWPCAGSP